MSQIIITTVYSNGKKLFKVNEIYDYTGIKTINKSSCACRKNNVDHYIVVIDGITHYIPVAYAVVYVERKSQVTDEMPNDFDYMREHIGDTAFVSDFSPYRNQNDQAEVQRKVNNNPM